MENNSKTKDKLLYKNVILSYLIKGFSLLISFLLTPTYIKYLNNQTVLGLWFTILSILNWVMFFDFGLGNGLRNKLTNSFHEEDNLESKKVISSTYISMGAISLLFLIVGISLISIINLNKFFNVTDDFISYNNLYLSVFMLLIGTVLVFFFSIINSILNSMQKSGITGIFGLITNIVLFIVMKTINFNNTEHNLLFLSLTFSLASFIPLMIATIVIFSNKLKHIRPSFNFYNRETAKQMLLVGGTFFWIQIAIIFINSTDQILISKIFNAESVVPFQFYHKLFYVFITLFNIVTNPIWSLVSKANSEKDYVWIKKTKNKLYLLSSFTSIGILVFVFLNQFAFDLWLKDNSIKVNLSYSFLFALYSIIKIFLFGITAIANGMGKLKPQLVGFTLGMVLKIPIILLLTIKIDSWIIIIIANIIIDIVTLTLNIYFIENEIFKKTKKENVYV